MSSGGKTGGGSAAAGSPRKTGTTLVDLSTKTRYKDSPAFVRIRAGEPLTAGPFAVCCRNKSDGSFTEPPKVDDKVSTWGNKVCGYFASEADAITWILVKGERCKLHVVCSKTRPHTPKIVLSEGERDPLDASNGWFVVRRFAFHKNVRDKESKWHELHLLSNHQKDLIRIT